MAWPRWRYSSTSSIGTETWCSPFVCWPSWSFFSFRRAEIREGIGRHLQSDDRPFLVMVEVSLSVVASIQAFACVNDGVGKVEKGILLISKSTTCTVFNLVFLLGRVKGLFRWRRVRWVSWDFSFGFFWFLSSRLAMVSIFSHWNYGRVYNLGTSSIECRRLLCLATSLAIHWQFRTIPMEHRNI